MVNSAVMSEDTGNTALAPVSTVSNTKELAMSVVKRHVWLCGGVGIIPVPFFDQVLIGGLLAKMLHDICGVYGVKWTNHKIKLIITSVLGGAHSQWIPGYVLHFAHLNQGAQLTGMMIARPVTAGGLAYVLGSWFVSHFESGAWLRNKEPSLFE